MAKKLEALVVSFSRSGATKKVADLVAETLGTEKIEEITEMQHRTGPLGYLRSAWEALVGIAPNINSPSNDPSQFDVVVLASPVWVARMASPMRTYLLKMESKLPRVAFLVTEGGSGGHRVLFQMRDLVRKMPLAELVLTEDELKQGGHLQKVKAFCERVVTQYEKEVAPLAVSVKKSMP